MHCNVFLFLKVRKIQKGKKRKNVTRIKEREINVFLHLTDHLFFRYIQQPCGVSVCFRVIVRSWRSFWLLTDCVPPLLLSQILLVHLLVHQVPVVPFKLLVRHLSTAHMGNMLHPYLTCVLK